jgi:hypothetical protein
MIKFFLENGLLLAECPISQPKQKGKDFNIISGNIRMVHNFLLSISGTDDSQHSSASST